MKRISCIAATALAVLLTAACNTRPIDRDVAGEGEGVSVQLTLSLEKFADGKPATRTPDAVTQDGTAFRGIQDIHLIPFERKGKIQYSDIPAGYCRPLEDISSLYETSNSRLYENYYVPWGTSSFLFYGVEPPYGTHAEGSVDFKKENGSIIAEGLGTRLPSQITFSPDPMMDAAAQTQFSTRLQEIADFLTDIAATRDYAYDHRSTTNSSYVPIRGARVYRPTVYFNNSDSWPEDNALLTNAFNAYTNNGEILAGSTAGINSLLTMLYRAARAQYNNTTYYVSYYRNTTSTNSQGEYYYVREMCRKIIEAFGSSSLVSVTNPTSASSASVSLNAPYDDIPGQYGIPAGAASFRYDYAQKKFIPGINDTGAALTASTRYCFPARLWYYDNTRIKTDHDSEKDWPGIYQNAANDWNAVLGEYDTDNGTVIGGVYCAALKEEVRYGVGMLDFTVSAASTSLQDATQPTPETVTVSAISTNLPITGIIIDGQFKQGFNFSALTGGEDYVIYDTAFAPAYLRTGESGHLRTLTFQSAVGSKIHFALELTNNTGVDFEGATGTILDGSKFYLLGTLDPKLASSKPDDMGNYVFYKAHRTPVTMIIDSLKDAYNSVPDLRDPQLQIGVVATIDWKMPTPPSIPLY